MKDENLLLNFEYLLVILGPAVNSEWRVCPSLCCYSQITVSLLIVLIQRGPSWDRGGGGVLAQEHHEIGSFGSCPHYNQRVRVVLHIDGLLL